MHELSIALSIVELAEEEAGKEVSSVITEVNLEVGLLTGVDLEALEFAIEMAKQDTRMSNAIIRIDKIPGRGHCKSCNAEFATDDPVYACPLCKNFSVELINGNELRLTSILVE